MVLLLWFEYSYVLDLIFCVVCNFHVCLYIYIYSQALDNLETTYRELAAHAAYDMLFVFVPDFQIRFRNLGFPSGTFFS